MELRTLFKNLKPKDAFKDILGQDKAKKEIISALMMGRHIILIGQPGIGKTTLAKNIAKLLPEITVNDCPFHTTKDTSCPECKGTKTLSGEDRFIRIQGSPDLTVEDIIGDIDPIKALKYGPSSLESFTPGKIFKANKGVLFFDELNRCPEKLQNALLQVLEEGRATIGSYNVDLETDFIFIGTMNPEDFAGTEKLSEVLLDRFDLVEVNHPEKTEIETEIVTLKGEALTEVRFPQNLLDTTVDFVQKLRKSDNLERTPSVRATLGLYERSQANAYLNSRSQVEFEDIMEAFVSVMAHRIKLKPSLRYLTTPEAFLKKEFSKHIEERKKDGEFP
jgi:magnesium chelatase subunit I